MDLRAHIRAQVLMEALRFDDAIAELRTALALDPQDARAHYMIGHCHLALDRGMEAKHAAEEALAIEPGHSEYHVLLANAVLNMHQPAKAIAHTDAALSIDPHNPEAHFIRAAALYATGSRKEAIDRLNETLRIEPDHGRALTFKARILSAGAYHLKAGESLDAALRLDPYDANTLATKAWGDLVHQRPGDHVRAFREVLALAPFNKLARRGLLLSSSRFAKRLAQREQLAEEGGIVDEESMWPTFTFYSVGIVSLICWLMSRGSPAFIAFAGMMYAVGIAFFHETWPCVLLLPSLLRRRMRELLPVAEMRITLTSDLLVVGGALWSAISPVVHGMHSIWGVTAMMSGSMMLQFRFKERTSPVQWIRWSYVAGLVALVVVLMVATKPYATWLAFVVMIASILWFRVHRKLDAR